MTMQSLAALIVLGLVTVHAVIALPETHDEELYDLYDPDIELNEGEDGEDVAVSETVSLRGRPTEQSTSPFDTPFPSGFAVDGDSNTCSQTGLGKQGNGEKDPWWRVELPSGICISKVTIHKREGNFNSRRLEGAVIRGGTSRKPGENQPCGESVSSAEAGETVPGSVIVRTCSTHPRGYVSVEISGPQPGIVKLCEVTVEGIPCH